MNKLNHLTPKVLKLVIAGDGATGKTTISKKLAGKLKLGHQSSLTIGLEFHSFEIIKKDGKVVIWDLGGQEQFRYFQNSFLKNADIVILVFSVELYPSFLNLDSWLSLVNQEKISRIYLLGNKMDLSNRAIHRREAIEYAEKHNLRYFEISALTGKGFEDFRRDLIETSSKLMKNYLSEHKNFFFQKVESYLPSEELKSSEGQV